MNESCFSHTSISLLLFIFSFPVRKSDEILDMLYAKRVCMRMAVQSMVIGSHADKFFLKSFDRVCKKIGDLNHATRFWIAFKFVRRHVTDFRKGCRKKPEYSVVRICNMLGIHRTTVRRAVDKYPTKSLKDLMHQFRYLSLTENDPIREKNYFKKVASNYDDLLESGYFR